MQVINNIKKYISEFVRGVFFPADLKHEKSIILQSLLVAKKNRDLIRIKNLSEVEFSGFSQCGEDGIIDWLVEKLPGIPNTFIEFGVEDYKESNTRLLLQLRNWRGYVMDGSAKHISSIKRQDISWRHDLTANCGFIDKDNINQLIDDSGMFGDIGLLSIDIDGNDYWIWQAIEVVSPIIVVCEYNAVLGDRLALTVPYQADFIRTHAHYSNLYFGASIRALISLGKSKGYTFVGSTSSGLNAFFVRVDHANSIVMGLENICAFPSKFREARDEQGNLLFVSGTDRRKLIDHLPVRDLVSDKCLFLAQIGEIYSTNWINGDMVNM